jgi:aminodeoxyfutalosine deaminase
MALTLTARWVFPVSGPPLEGGTVTVSEDRIEAVSPRGVQAADLDLGNAALVPGLVNAHTHLDLSAARGLIPPTDPDHFTDWLKGVIAFRRTRSAEQTHADTRAGLNECLKFGTMLVGDISGDGGSWETLAAAPTRAVVFRELIGGTSDRAGPAIVEGKRWVDAHPDTPTCRAALSPHAPYSAHALLYAFANVWRRPTTTHLAESGLECDFLRGEPGPMAEFLAPFGITLGLEPIRPERVLGWLDKPPHVVIAHGNHLIDPSAVRPNQTICYCPRTHAAFGHPPHPFREFLARGVRVCLGTDSLASNPDLDVLSEARFVRRLHPDFPGERLLRMVTLSGAEALGWADEVGSLEVGKSADLVAVPLPDADAPDPHELLLADHPGARRTMFRGAWRD